MQTHVTAISNNIKTGKIPVTTTSADSCSDTCNFKKKGCYGDNGPLGMHWRKVTNGERGLSYADFIAVIKALPLFQAWRHNQAGDLVTTAPGNGIIDRPKLKALSSANRGKRGWTYCHHPTDNVDNFTALVEANNAGFTINQSCDTIGQAVKAFANGLPTVVTLPMSAPNVQTVGGLDIVACPAETKKKVNCASCLMCQKQKRKYIIGFRAHGTKKKQVDLIASAA